MIWDTKLYVVGQDGEGLREITETGELVNGCSWICIRTLAWSPDGAQILLSSEVHGTYTVDARDFTVRKMSASTGYATWSPDSSRIAMLSEDPNAVLTSMQKDGSDVRVLVRTNEGGQLVPGNQG